MSRCNEIVTGTMPMTRPGNKCVLPSVINWSLPSRLVSLYRSKSSGAQILLGCRVYSQLCLGCMGSGKSSASSGTCGGSESLIQSSCPAVQAFMSPQTRMSARLPCNCRMSSCKRSYGDFREDILKRVLSWHATNAEIHFRAILHHTCELQPKLAGILSSLNKLNMCMQSV
jgi:hypothetical protein